MKSLSAGTTHTAVVDLTGALKRSAEIEMACKMTQPFNTCRYGRTPASSGHFDTRNLSVLFLTVSGHLITFGSNEYGQLGVGDLRERKGINPIAGVLAGKVIHRVSCGEGYTVVATSENQVSLFRLIHIVTPYLTQRSVISLQLVSSRSSVDANASSFPVETLC